MLLTIHIVIALLSLVVTSAVFFVPTIKRIALSYGFVIATVASGTALLIVNPTSILHVCLSGLFYTTVVSVITIATHIRIKKGARRAAPFFSVE